MLQNIVTEMSPQEFEIYCLELNGTKFTMEGDFYKRVLKDKFNIDVVIPDEDEREFVHISVFDTTKIHAISAVEFALE